MKLMKCNVLRVRQFSETPQAKAPPPERRVVATPHPVATPAPGPTASEAARSAEQEDEESQAIFTEAMVMITSENRDEVRRLHFIGLFQCSILLTLAASAQRFVWPVILSMSRVL